MKVTVHNRFLWAERTERRDTNCRNSLTRCTLDVTRTSSARLAAQVISIPLLRKVTGLLSVREFLKN